MFERLKSLFQKETVQVLPAKPVIITIHGYGRRRKHEFDNFALWGSKDQYEIIQFDMYDLFDETDNDWMMWVSRAKDMVNTYHNQGREIYLVGFSMGGVIASYLAATCDIKKLVLLAPAFSYMNVDTIAGAISKSYSSFISKSSEKKDEIELPKSFYMAFMDLVKNLKKYINQVPCPTLMIHGDEDEVISVRSSTSAYHKIPHKNKKLVILHEGHHRLFMDETVQWECYQWIKLFFEDVILNGQELEQAPDIMDELLQRYHDLHAQPVSEDEQLEVIVDCDDRVSNL